MTTTRTYNATGDGVGRTLESAARAELIDVKAVAMLLGGCSTRHVYRLADADRMPRPIRLGSLVRWRRAELEVWIDAGCPSRQLGGRRP